MSKQEMLADVDFMDVGVRQENINNIPGQPVQIQLGFNGKSWKLIGPALFSFFVLYGCLISLSA